jgi:Response regulator containing a CheY-like receiver domain and an HTH DNA-binding domain
MVRILLVDDHPLVRSGLRAEIEVHEGMQVVAEAGTAAEALERLAVERPHVTVIDVRLGDECGIDLGRRIVAQSPCATVLLTAFDWDVYLVRAWEAGAAAFVTKSDDTTALVEAIRGAADGARVFSAGTAPAHRRLAARCSSAPGAVERTGKAPSCVSSRKVQLIGRLPPNWGWRSRRLKRTCIASCANCASRRAGQCWYGRADIGLRNMRPR